MGDYKNQIRRFREKKGMTQRQLAAAVGTSQQQIQRWETGSPVKLNVAADLAASLETTVEKLFPDSARVAAKAIQDVNYRMKKETEEELLEAGIETDPSHWTARVLMRGGDPNDPMLFHINVNDKNRVVRYYLNAPLTLAERDAENAQFFVFDAGDRTVAINMEHVIFWQNLFDPGIGIIEEEETEEVPGVNVYLAGIREPMEFAVDQDVVKDDEEEGRFRLLLCDLDSNPEKDSFISFMDEDGEFAHFHVGEIAVIEVAKWVTDPTPLEQQENEDLTGSLHATTAPLKGHRRSVETGDGIGENKIN
jgi:transcriptional regulator with XRE-family HTH domain